MEAIVLQPKRLRWLGSWIRKEEGDQAWTNAVS
jgi:hypothetical protein